MSEQLHHTTVKECLETGEPYYGLDEIVPKSELAERVKAAKAACLEAHQRLYEQYSSLDHLTRSHVVTFDDEHSGELAKFISFKDKAGQPCYRRWDPTHAATDIGVRGVNPHFNGVANPVTVVHADTEAAADFAERDAPQVMIEAVDAVSLLNRFVVSQVVRPMLQQIAEEYRQDPRRYLEIFLPSDRRIRTLTRVILYHAEVVESQRPLGSDGQTLMIKEHHDQSSFTIDNYQSSPGLQYYFDGSWHDAQTRVACLRGSADSYLPEDTPPTLHRVRHDPDHNQRVAEQLQGAGITRLAMPTFISASGEGVRVVKPSSPETHPTAALCA